MGNINIMVWLLLFAVFGLCTWWHVKENKTLAARWKTELKGDTSQWLERFAWSRTVQLLSAIGCSVLVILIYDWQLNDTKHQLQEIKKVQATAVASRTQTAAQQAAQRRQQQQQAAVNRANEIRKAQAQQQLLQQQQQQARRPQTYVASTQPNRPIQPAAPARPAAPAGAQAPGSLEAAAAIAARQQQLDQTAIAAPTPFEEPAKEVYIASSRPNATTTVEDLYNPERQATDSQSAMDDIKKRYEDILVIYMFLKKCNKVESADYNVITSALGQEMASVNAPGRLQYDIITAARGSYQEIYSRSSCTGETIPGLISQYNTYIKALATNYPPPGG